MESLPLHPSIVHVPMALGALMPLVAAGLALAWWRGWLPRRAWWVAVALQAVLVVSSVVALRTGEAEEDKVERVMASEASIEAHEEAAELFMWASAGVLVIMLAGALISRERIARPVAVAALVASLGVLTLGIRVGQLGGTVVYRDGAARAYQVGADTGPAYGMADYDDDDD